ncbi:PilZ domain-containing protein [Sansalvadorimonas sp. 2012CJ34-2]|uniref:PilZ domain-containing protein n=1 Tax=Parendozoicomonas callyspongiae TaxID=2942213 RepID=A0ABT0PBV4_9GAMM|nr:PilZ domain-containing protein [Sansalvadorimonas sp. 2012CJ34-2]MCL6268763.1 PilZ domain-containing protein [Sansalvadorimonas sp. 2012CJ34-2]
MAGGSPKGSILTVTIKDKGVLYSSYMPFLKGGGLFVPSMKKYDIGDEVFLRLTLMDEPGVLPVAGRVVWVTPAGAQGNGEPGIGVQFTDQDGSIRVKIEAHLGGLLQSDRPTNTM